MQHFVRFHAIECETEVSHEFLEKQNGSVPLQSNMYPNFIIVISTDIYFEYKLLCNFIRDHRIPKNSNKVQLQRHLLSDFSPKFVRNQFILG